ncbi:MAG: hypothetical protein QW514_02580 [Thermoprotei archaeon]
MSLNQPITKAFSAAMLSITVVLLIMLLLVGLTANALPNRVRYNEVSVSQLGGVTVFSAQASISNPGPLPLEELSAGLSFTAPPSFEVEAFSHVTSVGVGENTTLPINLSVEPSGAAACVLLFHGGTVVLGFMFNTSLGGILPIHVVSYTNLSFGALLGGITVELTQSRYTSTQSSYTVHYSFTDNNDYLPVNATLLLLLGGRPQTSLSLPLNAQPTQYISNTKSFVGPQTSPENITLIVQTMWGAFTLPYNQNTQSYSGDVVCG